MVSIILLCKNGADTLDRCLAGIFRQQAPFDYEVIVIDSGSTDGSLDIARRYAVTLQQIPPQEFNYGATKNYSLQFARGEFVVFVSQDAIALDDDWLHELIRPMIEDDAVAGVYSRQIAEEPCNLYESYLMRSAYGEAPVVWDKRKPYAAMSFSNASSGIRRSLLEAGPFKRLPFAEDRVWAVEQIEAGRSIVYNPRSKVLHSHDFTVRQYFRRSRQNAVTKRLIDGYRASLRPLLTRFMNPIGIAKLLRRSIRSGEELGIANVRSLRAMTTFYLFTLAEYLGNVSGSRFSTRGY